MHPLFNRISLLLLSCPLAVMAQEGSKNYSQLELKDLSSFEKAATNWSVQGDVSMIPVAGTKPKLTSGSGVIVGNAGDKLVTKLKATDLRLALEFMVSPGAEGNIILPGGSKLHISDSYNQSQINSNTSGYMELFPIQNAAKAPGLWQTLELAYDGKVENKANTGRLNWLSLNKVIVLETVYVPLKNQAAGGESIAFEITKGSIAFKNIGYQLLASEKPLQIADLKYKVYSDQWDAKEYSTLDHEGTSPVLTQEVNKGMRQFHLVYEGTMNVDEAGDYLFTSIYSGPVLSLDIDGKGVLDTGESTSQESHSALATLTKGKHTFKIHYSRFPWRQPALGLRVEKAGIRTYDLHTLSSLPTPEPKPTILASPDKKPDMIRSFILLEGEKYKRTHCISVGSPNGWSYTMDLNRGALLQAWRGQFADVTEMWYERGEPQLLFPAGLTIPVSGKSSIAQLSSQQTAWPDSANVNYLGYKIDNQGYPGYNFAIGSGKITDHLVSGTDGITRTFNTEGNVGADIYALAASGKNISEVSAGLYRVDNRYYVQVDKKSKIILRNGGDGQELILPVVNNTSYKMFW